MKHLPLYAFLVLSLETALCMDIQGSSNAADNTLFKPSDLLEKRSQAWHSYFGKRGSAYKRLPGWSVYYGKRSDEQLTSSNDLSENVANEMEHIDEFEEDKSVGKNKMKERWISGFDNFDLENESQESEAVKRSNFKRLQTWISTYGKRDDRESEIKDENNDELLHLNVDSLDIDTNEKDHLESYKEDSGDQQEEDKRMQGWGSTYGKRSGWSAVYGKRAPGWHATYGKRAPVWFTAYGKRAPGWHVMYGKRAPGWSAMYGKRAPGWSAMYGKRAPGWTAMYGKRAAAWHATYGKRVPGWQAFYGKRSPQWQATYGKRDNNDFNALSDSGNTNFQTDLNVADTQLDGRLW